MLLDALVLPDVARGALSQDVVLKHICQIVTLRLATGRTVVFVVGAEGVVLIDHIIELQLRRPSVPGMSYLLGGVTRHLIWPHVVKHVVDLQALVVIIGAHPERARQVESTRAVVGGEVIIQRTSILVHELRTVLEAEAFALCLLQRDTHDGLHRGGITGTWILNHIDVLNLIGTQTREFLHILHPSAVDIHLGIATTQHLHATFTLSLQRRNLRQGIAHGSGLLQYRTSDPCSHSIAFYTCFGQASFYHHTTQFLRLVKPHCRVCRDAVV